MRYFERFYEESYRNAKGDKKVNEQKFLALELIAFPEKDSKIPSGKGYYFRGDFTIWPNKDGKFIDVVPQSHGKFAKKNNKECSGWHWYWNDGNLKQMSTFVQKLDGFKPISEEHQILLGDQINLLESCF